MTSEDIFDILCWMKENKSLLISIKRDKSLCYKEATEILDNYNSALSSLGNIQYLMEIFEDAMCDFGDAIGEEF